MRRIWNIAGAMLALCSVAVAQDFNTYLGKIQTTTAPLPLAADASGGLYYATFDVAGSQIVYLADPVATLAGSTAATTISQTSLFVAPGRGYQGLQVAPDGSVFASGDRSAGPAYVRKFGPAPGFVEDTTFQTNTATNANRLGGLAIVSSAGDGLLAAATFNSINYFKFDGTATGLTNIGGAVNYQREPVYNSTDNVIYPLKNGNSQTVLIAGYLSGINAATGGGTWNAATVIGDGATSTTFGSSTQHGYYHAATNQLFTCDTDFKGTVPPAVRVWNVSNGGATLTLAYAIDGTLGNAGWTTASDCVVIGNRLYVSSTNDNGIYVYTNQTAVSDWSLYD